MFPRSPLFVLESGQVMGLPLATGNVTACTSPNAGGLLKRSRDQHHGNRLKPIVPFIRFASGGDFLLEMQLNKHDERMHLPRIGNCVWRLIQKE